MTLKSQTQGTNGHVTVRWIEQCNLLLSAVIQHLLQQVYTDSPDMPSLMFN